MLTNLHVKNLALIEEADINFFDGLNIMTGETGAGKSIILGSVNIALGGKVTADIIRKGAEYALTELAFHIDDKKKIAAIILFSIFSIVFWVVWYLTYMPVLYHWGPDFDYANKAKSGPQ